MNLVFFIEPCELDPKCLYCMGSKLLALIKSRLGNMKMWGQVRSYNMDDTHITSKIIINFFVI